MKNIILFLFLSLTLFANSEPENIAETPVGTTEVVEQVNYIKMSDIPTQAINTLSELKTVKEAIKEKKEIQEMQSLVKPYVDSLAQFLDSSNYQDFTKKKVRDLQKMQSEIAIYLKQLEEWDTALKARIKVYDKNSVFLKDYSSLWSETHMNSVKKDAPEAILKHITSVIVEVEILSNNVKSRYDKTLINSQVVSTNILKLNEISTSLKKEEELRKTNIFVKNEPSLFELLSSRDFSFLEYFATTIKTAEGKYSENIAYIQTNEALIYNFLISTFFIALFIAYFYYLYKNHKLFVRGDSYGKKAFQFLRAPGSILLILALLSSNVIFDNRPQAFIDAILLLAIPPVIRILHISMHKEIHKYFYSFIAIYLLYLIDKNSISYELESRVIMIIFHSLFLVYIVKILKDGILKSIKYPYMVKFATYIFVTYLLLLITAIGSDIYGSVLLSNRISEGIFTTFYASLIFYTVYLVLTGYVVIMLRRRMSSASNMLDIYARRIEKTTTILIKIWMFSWWILIVAKITGAYPYITKLRDDFLALSWQLSSMTISVQSIFDFSLIVIATWLIARVTRTILEIEVFSRFTLPRGFPTAVLTTLNYIIIISGTIIAFSSLGVSAQQFALIFGALGVGIGFGLRNIIANFVSGIIMVFERPVQIGDTIEVDGTMGGVQSIGARSSVIKTFDGSEVIIPNADFIAKEIVNWTLSNEHRRKTLEFKVALGSDIDEVLEIMKDATLNHPDVLKDPEPLATFKGFDEYYLRFKLYYWLADNLIVAQSDIAIEVYRRLQKSGVDMPIPKVQHKGQE